MVRTDGLNRDANGFPDGAGGFRSRNGWRLGRRISHVWRARRYRVRKRHTSHPAEIERDRTDRPPFAPYVFPGSLAEAPWLPTDDPKRRALDRWATSQLTHRRYVGNQDLSTWRFVLYRMRFIVAGDLTGDWADFGWIGPQINPLATVLSMPITDHPDIALAYD